MLSLEVAAETLDDALHAHTGGAASLEILRELAVGGLTPPLELVRAIRVSVPLPLRVMLRPHARSFAYSDADVEMMLADLEQIKLLGVQSIVFGAHTRSGDLDIALIQRIAQAAAPVPLSLHRALDTCRNPDEALTALAGVLPRVLTAGPALTAWDGREGLARWIERFGQHYSFAASGGLTAEQLPDYLAQVSIDQVHLGGAVRTAGRVDPDKVRSLAELLSSFRTGLH
jgi:copper homeostasis protein